MLGIERASLAEQMFFWGQGDLMYCECSREYAREYAERIKKEALFALSNGNRFRDGSILEGTNLECAKDLQRENES